MFRRSCSSCVRWASQTKQLLGKPSRQRAATSNAHWNSSSERPSDLRPRDLQIWLKDSEL